VYAHEFARTGFQGDLQWYRCLAGKYVTELETFSGRTIDVPACFIAGKSDWGVYQFPVRLRGWRPRLVLNGAAHISSMARDIGFSKNSPKKSVVFCWNSSTRREARSATSYILSSGLVGGNG
jgi:hypothetical protein